MEYKEFEDSLRDEATRVARENKNWAASEVSVKLRDIANELATIRREHRGGIDASMGKRSGWKVDI